MSFLRAVMARLFGRRKKKAKADASIYPMF
ncbi:hypothetical protein FHX80_115697 [Streptomyces brevispora]|uniref:Uncharacterized protein n=1 Tax=Streptomyces brevispora TaxID=887462 RepID=A0A561V6F2_9ACTN|nr:hypothetical protein FHX80_115697 [Streptomyces brevispora]